MPEANPPAWLLTPAFRALLDEWRIHVEVGQDPDLFANLFLECMRDPQNDEMRRVATSFITYARPRSWEAIRNVMGPHLDAATRGVFELPNARSFYEGFRDKVIAAVQEYWTAFLESRKGKSPRPSKVKDWSPRAAQCLARGDCGDPLHRRCGRRRAV